MRSTLLLFMLVIIAPLGACADESAHSSDAVPSPVAPISTDYPSVYDATVHNNKAAPEPAMTYGEFVEFVYSDVDPSEFYAKNPEWVPFKDKKMTSEKVMLGVNL